MTVLVALARSPREGAEMVLRGGRLPSTLLLIAVATAISIVHTLRFASEVSVEDVMFGPQRSPLIGTLLSTLGVQMTSIVLYLVQRSWDALLVVTALAPILLWLLGATAVHAAARLAGIRRPFMPMLVLLGHATGVTRPLADLAGIVLGSRGMGASLAQLVGGVALIWLGVLAWHGIRAHYGVTGGQALTILVVAVVLFYLAPLTVILVAVAAILVSAIVLEYVPAR